MTSAVLTMAAPPEGAPGGEGGGGRDEVSIWALVQNTVKMESKHYFEISLGAGGQHEDFCFRGV